ncbi:class I SAM-dependent methyltransferase [Paenarthrobacter sp. Z7-10]|uniref:class I SAM-dependent methyltransferase n=1 Tax=Paenarthrobacter sp. Z7-10 TaxID=2787635 RepID=UPI0022A923D8|nr:class I SAM-dependent methyltransferase [Paenarthrobacter sp. Z7-10]MCZ2403592.1 class I SAM-dependent methyltransferase [Paenarthrobacter sp. Z7-10]
MSAEPQVPFAVPAVPALGTARRRFFGQGGAEPYARGLQHGVGTLILRPANDSTAAVPLRLQLQHWCAPAAAEERALLRGLRGPVLDVGCGPGRMLAAAAAIGLKATGVDSSEMAVQHARARGAMVLNSSIFDALPQEGRWGSALLLDGNIGIGGNVGALLARLAQLLDVRGSVLVEVDPRADMDLAYQAILEDAAGHLSEPFPWSRVGADALAIHAAAAGWRVAGTAGFELRGFCWLRRVGPPH